MARKKEPERLQINKNKIMNNAKKLFLRRGIEQTSMEDIAKETNICKATLYTYYHNREAIRNDIVLEAMLYLYNTFSETINISLPIKDNFMSVCNSLFIFKQKYPLSFQYIVENICIDEAILSENETLQKIYETGEKINLLLINVFGAALPNKSKNEVVAICLEFWGSIYGIISVAENKKDYIKKTTGKNQNEFINDGFEHLFQILKYQIN